MSCTVTFQGGPRDGQTQECSRPFTKIAPPWQWVEKWWGPHRTAERRKLGVPYGIYLGQTPVMLPTLDPETKEQNLTQIHVWSDGSNPIPPLSREETRRILGAAVSIPVNSLAEAEALHRARKDGNLGTL